MEYRKLLKKLERVKGIGPSTRSLGIYRSSLRTGHFFG